jgi:hypothetical protein
MGLGENNTKSCNLDRITEILEWDVATDPLPISWLRTSPNAIRAAIDES